MKSHVYRVLALTVLAATALVAAGEPPARRFAAPDANTSLELCHRIHLLPVGSVERARALQSCPDLHAAIPKKYQDGPSQQKIDYGTVLEAERAKKITKAQDRVPTPEELAGLKALEDSQLKLKSVEDSIAANKVAREADAAKAEKQAAQDQLDREAQWKNQVEDQQKIDQYKNDVNAAAAAKVHDELDLKRVEKAKQEWADFETRIADAKAKAASDVQTIEAYKAKIKDASAQRDKDKLQREADEAEAKADAQMTDDADKAARAKARDDRAKEREARESQLEKELEEARRARDDARDRQQALVDEADTRAAHRAEQEDADAALAANRKRRQDADAERQQRMDAYKKEEADINARREKWDKEEKEREARLKKRQEEDDARAKKQKDDDDLLAKKREEDTPLENRKKQDDEEECTTKEVSCGSGQCFQKKNDPKSKRCQCQKDDKGKNCEHAGCAYDVTDGAGKTSQKKGNMVNGQCVRWEGTYRCTCNKPWRLDVKCMKMKGTSEVEVPKTECHGLRELENEYKDQVCELCGRTCSLGRRELSVNETSPKLVERVLVPSPAPAPAPSPPTCIKFEASCNNRMARSRLPFVRPRLVTASGASSLVTVDTFEACEDKCIERNGATAAQKNKERPQMKPRSHCTWVYAEEIVKAQATEWNCYMFFTGQLPELAEAPPPVVTNNKRTASGQLKNKPADTGFISFVVYPRRWDLYREYSADTTPKYKVLCDQADRSRRYYFFSGKDTARTEGDGSFVVTKFPNALSSSSCISTPDTVLENAQAYETRVKKLNSAVGIPSAWARYGIARRSPAGVTSLSQNSGIQWTYTVDDQFRVVEARGDMTVKLHEGPRKQKKFEEDYNALNIMQYLKKQKAPFCAGHVIAYQQRPPNFYFNYVPQHDNSNGGQGAWLGAEIAAQSLVDLGCHLRYVVDIDYDENGAKTPHQMKNKLEPWATVTTSGLPTDANTAPGPPDDTHEEKVGTRFAYVNDKLKCHYRYRPFVMSLDYSIIGGTSHCENVHAALNVPQAVSRLIEIQGANIVTTRIFAYLLQKEASDPSQATKIKDIVRVLRVATAMKKPGGSTLRMYAETGNIAPFNVVEMKFEFFAAFLTNVENNECLKDPGDPSCDKWTMEPDTHVDAAGDTVPAHYGLLYTHGPNSKCIKEDPNDPDQIIFADNDGSDDCARFEYDYAAPQLTLNQAGSLPNSKSIEDLVSGTIVFGPQRDRCLERDMSITGMAADCWKVRISYYVFGTQQRALAEADDGDEAGDEDTCGVDDDCGCV